MTLRAGVTVVPCGVIRICGSRIIAMMTGITVRGQTAVVLPVRVARTTGHGRVRPRQGENGHRMIEGRRLPRCVVVALRTRMAELVVRVMGTGRAAIVRLMAGIAIHRRTRVLAVHVALIAGRRRMRTG
jgi:hypothetical protein